MIQSTIKEWFIIIQNQQAGPYSLSDLRKEPSFNPDTLVWRKGFQEWIQARFIPEMQDVFKDLPQGQSIHESGEKGLKEDVGQESQMTLSLQQDPYQFLLWLLLLLLIFFVAFYQAYYHT